MSPKERYIVVITETPDGLVEKKIEVDLDADSTIDSLELTPSKFVKEVIRKLKKNS